MNIREFDVKRGFAQQGDLILVKIPDDIQVNTTDEIMPQNGSLIALEGEMTGHHHSFDVMERPMHRGQEGFKSPSENIQNKVSKALEDVMHVASNVTAPEVKMYRDTAAANKLRDLGILERTDLMVGILVVSGGGALGAVLKHQEHDAWRLPAGKYYVGRQVESVGAEERRVAD